MRQTPRLNNVNSSFINGFERTKKKKVSTLWWRRRGLPLMEGGDPLWLKASPRMLPEAEILRSAKEGVGQRNLPTPTRTHKI
jgi:hypothetical protein